jgi:hypothetical protein
MGLSKILKPFCVKSRSSKDLEREKRHFSFIFFNKIYLCENGEILKPNILQFPKN